MLSEVLKITIPVSTLALHNVAQKFEKGICLSVGVFLRSWQSLQGCVRYNIQFYTSHPCV